MKLFCIPYAGGSAAMYTKWNQYLDPAIELIPVELAGRGTRIHEPCYANLDEAVADVFRFIRHHNDNAPYALFGHSMGGLIVYRLAHAIRQQQMPQPAHLFFSGKSAPHVRRLNRKKYHLMDDETFKEALIKLGGTPPDLFDHPPLMQLFLPLLRNDFRIAETEIDTDPLSPFEYDITVFLGRNDDMNVEQCEGWRQHTNRNCHIHYFDGGHFFLHDETKDITAFINKRLNRIPAC